MTEKTMKHIFIGVILIFAGSLAVACVQGLDMNALAMIVGIVIGVLVSIPVSIIFALVTRRLQARNKHLRRKRGQSPVVMLVKSKGITHFPRGDGNGHFCYPNPR